MDNNCYRFEKYTYTDGIFHKSVDATYILHLEGDPRLSNIKKQLSIAHPTNIVYIVFNKGFKKCKKNLSVQSSMADIVHANMEVFKHANSENYKNILVLEDDFIFNPDIKKKEHINNINNFLNKNDKDKFIYHLGALPFFVFPCNQHTYCTIAAAMHAGIFTKSAQEYVLNDINKHRIDDWDTYLNFNIRRYVYYKSLCHQTVANTENKQNWNLSNFTRYLINKYIEITNFDKEPEPGTNYIYIFAKVFSLFIFLLIVFIIYVVLSYLKVFKYISKGFKGYRLKR